MEFLREKVAVFTVQSNVNILFLSASWQLGPSFSLRIKQWKKPTQHPGMETGALALHIGELLLLYNQSGQ